jgi:uncharacterized repeat protein (TIGR01451 family)
MPKKIFLAVLIVVSGWGVVAAAAAPDNIRWVAHNNGITGSVIVGIVVDSSTPTTVYVLSNGGGVYKSTNSGTSWTAANTGLPNGKFVNASHLYGNLLTADPNDSAVLYANFNGKVFATADGAGTWSESNTGISPCAPRYAITGVAVDPTDSTHLFAGHTVSGCSGGIFESTNSGSSWTHIATTGDIGNDAWPIVVDPSDANTLYTTGPHNSLLYSHDGGASWTQSVIGDVGSGLALAVNPDTPARVLLGNENGLYVSEDGGVTWTAHTADVPGVIHDIVFAPSDASIGFAASDEGLFKTTDGGVTWAEVGSHASLSPHALAVDPSDPTIVYLGSSGSGMYRSSNGGTTFSAINSGIPTDLTINATAIAPSNHDVYYATVSGVGFFRSDDAGYTWQEQSTSYGTVNASNYILVDPTDEDVLYAGLETVYKSTDGGATWDISHDPAGDQFFQGAAIDPGNPDHVFVGDSGAFVYQTFNGGSIWNDIATYSTSGFIYKTLFDESNTDNVYSATYSHLFKSTDNGVSWSEITNGLTGPDDEQLDALAIDPTLPSRLFVGSRADHVLISTDSGDSWTPTAYDSPAGGDTPQALIVAPSGILYAFSTYGWQKSTDHGDTWSAMPTTGLSSPFYIFKFTAAIDPDDANRFLAGDFYDGINIFENYVPDFGASSADVVDENGGDRIAGDTATYTVTVENDGPADAHAVELSVSVPNGAEFVPGSAQIDSVTISDPASPTFSLSLGTLLRGESVTVTFGFAVDTSFAAFNAKITSDEDVSGTDVRLPGFAVESAPRESSPRPSGGGGGKKYPPLAVVPTVTPEATTTALFLRDVRLGDTGDDVWALQKFLNTHGFVLSDTGAGSPGHETRFFGILTKKALAAFQNAHAADILLPAGLPEGGGTGFLGLFSRKFINTLL